MIKSLIGMATSFAFYVVDFFYPKDENLVLVGAGSGRSYFNNARCVFEHIRENEPDLNAVWVTGSEAIRQHLIDKLGQDSVCISGRLRSLHKILRARFVLLSHGSNDILYLAFSPSPRKKVIYLDHGVANKKTGFMASGKSRFIYEFEFLRYDYWIAQSYAEAIVNNKNFHRAPSRFLITGKPKMDEIVASPGPKKVLKILYAPTYGSEKLFPFDVDLAGLNRDLKHLGLQLLISAHRNDYAKGNKDNQASKELSNIEWMQQDSTYDIGNVVNEVDLLITDYSSVFWDFFRANKPVVFVCPEEGPAHYDSLTYLDYSFLSGDFMAQNYKQLVKHIGDIRDGAYDASAQARNTFITDLFFDKEDNNLSGSAAIAQKIKELGRK